VGAVPGEYTRIAVGGTVDGWVSYADSVNESPVFTPEGVTTCLRTLLLYFTSGTTAKPKLVEHTQVSYRGPPVHDVLIGLRPGDVHLISPARLGQARLVERVRAVNAGATVLIYTTPGSTGDHARRDRRAGWTRSARRRRSADLIPGRPLRAEKPADEGGRRR